MDNIPMTPWSRANVELSSRKRDWQWLADQLEIPNIQRVNHWKQRGIPAKYHVGIENALGKHRGWITGDVASPNEQGFLTEEAVRLAGLFDLIPEGDRLRRAMALAGATDAILKVIQPARPTDQKSPDSGKPIG